MVFLSASSLTLRSGLFEDLFRYFRPLRITAMDGKQNPSLHHAAFVTLSFELGNPETRHSAGDTFDRASRTYTGEGCNNRAGSDEGANPRYG
jgi:hypothetical protein